MHERCHRSLPKSNALKVGFQILDRFVFTGTIISTGHCIKMRVLFAPRLCYAGRMDQCPTYFSASPPCSRSSLFVGPALATAAEKSALEIWHWKPEPGCGKGRAPEISSQVAAYTRTVPARVLVLKEHEEATANYSIE